MAAATLHLADPAGSDRADQIAQLRSRIQRMEQTYGGREIPTHPALSGILQLRAGASYATDSVALALALLAGPSAAGEWAAVIGMPDFGVEAAASIGVRLERTIVVPDPGESWLEAAAALVDVTGLVLVAPPGRVPARVAEKLSARLRTRGAALVALSSAGRWWPGADLRLRVADPRWVGVGSGQGHLRARRLTVCAQRGTAPVRRTEVWFPGAEGELCPAQATASAGQEVG